MNLDTAAHAGHITELDFESHRSRSASARRRGHAKLARDPGVSPVRTDKQLGAERKLDSPPRSISKRQPRESLSRLVTLNAFVDAHTGALRLLQQRMIQMKTPQSQVQTDGRLATGNALIASAPSAAVIRNVDILAWGKASKSWPTSNSSKHGPIDWIHRNRRIIYRAETRARSISAT